MAAASGPAACPAGAGLCRRRERAIASRRLDGELTACCRGTGGPNFTVADEIRNDGFLNYCTLQVRQPQTSFEVVGTELLRERVAELAAVAEVSHAKAGSTFVEAAEKAAAGPFRFARSLITAPSATLVSSAGGMSSCASNVGHALFGATGAGEEGALKTAIGFATAKRAYAYSYGVDPYPTSPVLQQELEDIA